MALSDAEFIKLSPEEQLSDIITEAIEDRLRPILQRLDKQNKRIEALEKTIDRMEKATKRR